MRDRGFNGRLKGRWHFWPHRPCGRWPHAKGPTLLDCECGDRVIVDHIGTDIGCAQRLRELGILEGAELVLLGCGDPLVVLAKDSRIAIDPSAAAWINISYLPVQGGTPRAHPDFHE